MIRHIVAIDNQRGMAKNHAMPPWHLADDEAYFTEKTLSDGGVVLMGKKTFIEALRNRPLKDRTNYVVTRDPSPIEGATVVNDLERFVREWPDHEVLWVIGGSEIFAQTMDVVNELYVTEIDGNFDCDRFYPEYQDTFELSWKREAVAPDGLRYAFCVYRRKP